eukprot:CAMPEP_0113463312 /NCGR_PEP_ID=MMETSP0014_2-20120614/12576_1 /TAXON_ID=2857 /ORGANISM="Nitzschia sp." /LENGTH=337 /DNA_ID=CAMNT_0000355269 /DNA_START=111 /DNA_END=1121 /DNA_ORIENTATION=+ /assembly_acc=CAM_ASM_000159
MATSTTTAPPAANAAAASFQKLQQQHHYQQQNAAPPPPILSSSGRELLLDLRRSSSSSAAATTSSSAAATTIPILPTYNAVLVQKCRHDIQTLTLTLRRTIDTIYNRCPDTMLDASGSNNKKPVWEMRPYLTQLQSEVERLRRCLLAYHKFRLGLIKQIVSMGGMDPHGNYIVGPGGGGGGGSGSAASGAAGGGAEDGNAPVSTTSITTQVGPPITSNKSELEFAKKYLELRDGLLMQTTSTGEGEKMPYYLFRPPVPCSSVAGGGGGSGAGSSSSLVQVRVINSTTGGGAGAGGGGAGAGADRDAAAAEGNTHPSSSSRTPQVVMLPDSGQFLTLQ